MAVFTGDILRVTVEGSFDGTDAVQNVWKFGTDFTATQPDSTVLSDLAGIMRTQYAAIDEIFPDSVAFTGVHVVNLSQGTILGDETFISPVVGSSSAPVSGTVQSILAVWNTGIPRRQARKYLGPIAEDVVGDDGQIGGAFQGLVQGWAEDFLVEIAAGGNGYLMVVMSNDPADVLVANTAKVIPIPAIQRRRKIRRGV